MVDVWVPLDVRRRGVPPAAMFLFFSNRLGCLGSLLISVIATVVLILVLRWRPEGILAERPARLSVRRPGRPARMGAKAADA